MNVLGKAMSQLQIEKYLTLPAAENIKKWFDILN